MLAQILSSISASKKRHQNDVYEHTKTIKFQHFKILLNNIVMQVYLRLSIFRNS
ncbi:hypothetical protein ALT1545_380003 [Alteromonas macleodii]